MARIPNLTSEDWSVKTLYPKDETYDELPSEARVRRQEEFDERLVNADGIIVSDTDLDGVGCAAILQSLYSDKNYPYIQVNHNSTLSPAETLEILAKYVGENEFENIFVCDLPPTNFELYSDSIVKIAESNMVTIIDHHDVWEKEMVKTLAGNWVSVFLDNGISAAEITYLQYSDELSDEWGEFAKQVTDHDCHYNQLDISSRLADFVDEVDPQTAVDKTLIHIDDLGNSQAVESVLEESRQVKQKKIDLALSRSTMDTYKKHSIASTYGRCPASQTAERFFDVLDTDIVLISRPTNKLHVRTITDIPIAREIAREFGGGGHDTEAGAQIKMVGDRISWYKHWSSMGRDVQEEARETAKEIIDSFED